MLRVLALVALVGQVVVGQFASRSCTDDRTATIQADAEAMIGGIIRMRQSGQNGYGCGKPVGSMQSYEALRWALDLINKKGETLNGQFLTDYYVPGIRLGMKVIDYCGQEDAAVAAVSQLFPSLANDKRACTDSLTNITLGIVGTSQSGSTADVASFTDNFDIPVVSYQATAPSLTFSGLYPNFLRTIPLDSELVKVMAQVMLQLNWKYVVVVYEDSGYGHSAYDALRPALASAGICLTAAIMANPDDTTSATVQGVIRQALGTGAVGAVFLGDTPMGEAILREGMNVIDAGKLQWMFTDTLPLDANYSSYAYTKGILSVLPASRYIVEFEDHWVRINLTDPSPENPWYQEWYTQKYQCSLPGFTTYSTPCSQTRQTEREKRITFVQDQYVEPAVHSVFAYANALRQAQIAKCGANSRGICPMLRNMTHTDFLNNYLKKVEFTYAALERVPSLASDQYAPYFAAKKLHFDTRGDIISPAFSVWNYNNLQIGLASSGLKFREVGSYLNGRLTLLKQSMEMYDINRIRRLPTLPESPCPATGCSPCLSGPQDMKYMYVDGDIIINGIFSLHDMGASKFSCGNLASNLHPQYLEAMFYAIKQVNSKGILQGQVRLGGLGIDDCMDSDLSVNFIKMVQRGLLTVKDPSGVEMDPRKVEAYSGAYSNQLTIPLAGLMDTYLQPLVGYKATSAKLDKYQYYLKVVPGMADEFRAIILILKNYKWNHVQIVYSTDMYDEDDITLFRRLAAEAGICVVASYDISKSGNMTVNMLSHHDSVRPVVLLLSASQLRGFLQMLKMMGPSGDFNYIATPTLGNNKKFVEGYESVTQGFISIDLTMSELGTFFTALNRLRVNNYSTENPWFTEWYETLHNCSVDTNLGSYPAQCPDIANKGVMDTVTEFNRELQVGHVINAIYATAYGLDKLLELYCGTSYTTVCGAFTSAGLSTKGEDLLDAILSVSFAVEDLPSQTFSFQGRSGRLPYTIYNFQAVQGTTGSFVSVGNVNPFANTISVTGTVTLYGGVLPSQVMPTCPQPCIECLYMFAFQRYWYLDGDLIIPAVFDVHFKGSSVFSCGELRHMNGVQYTEAFKFMLDYINNNNASGITLNNVRLGGIAFDGCSNAVRSSAIINGVMGRTFPIMDDNDMVVDPSRFISWLTYDSKSTMEAADLLKMIGMPIVTPGARAPQLLNKTLYSTFFRTVPSDSVIARAMADLMQNMGWRYVITLNAPDEGSRAARNLFRQYMEEMGICVVASYEFETDGTVNIILNSIADSTTDVVAVFSEADIYIPDMLLTKAKLTNLGNDLARITFVSNRFWDLDRVRDLSQADHKVAYNTLSFHMKNTNVQMFINYLQSLTLAGSSNPWLPEYYQALFQCNLAGSTRYTSSCETTRRLFNSSNIRQDIYTLTTINAVHALAVAVDRTLDIKCGTGYSGVCSQFLTDGDTLDILMETMDNETFTDLASHFFDFVEREVNREYDVMRHLTDGNAVVFGSLSGQGVLSLTGSKDNYKDVQSACPEDCLVCERFETNFRNFSYIDGDLFIVGLFDVHKKGATPYTCGSINYRQGLQLLEAFNFAIEYMNNKQGELFGTKLRGVRIGGIGIDVCNSPIRAANLVANIQSGNIILRLSGGITISPNQIMAYVGPFDTPTTISVADILSAIGIPQITFGATGLQLQDPIKYNYLLRSVPADDKQARAIISYLKKFNLTNVQVVTSFESIGLEMAKEFKRLAILNLVCITKEYTVGESGTITQADAQNVVQAIVQTVNAKAKVVVLLVHDPFPILQAAGANTPANREILWVATDKWGYDQEYLDGRLNNLLGDRNVRDNVIIFDIETADVPLLDQYLEDKTPGNYGIDPWFQEYYEFLLDCIWNEGSCDATRGISRAENYVQDPYALYVINAVFSSGLGIHYALKQICDEVMTTGYDGLCLKFQATGYRRDYVLQGMKLTNFTDDTHQPFYYEPTGESGRGYHIYNVTANTDGIGSSNYMYEDVGSYNDTHFLKLDITYDVVYEAQCTPFVDCSCKFPRHVPSRYMAKPSPFELNLVYIGDIHQAHPTDPFSCSSINIGTDFYKMMAFFYAIDRVNINKGQVYPDSLRLGGVAVDTCSSTLRLNQDIFNLLSGFPLCDTDDFIQIVPPSSIVAFVPDSNNNSVPVSQILAATGITSLSPSATSPELHNFYMSENFLSIVPPLDVQATVILKMMELLNWNYASIIYTEEPSMIAAKNELLSQAAIGRTACFGQALALPLTATIKDAEDALEKMSQQVGARAVILFTLPAHTRLLLQAAGNKGMTGRFVWIGTSAWGESGSMLTDLENEASGAIILQPRSVMVEEFRTYIKSLAFANRGGIPDDWFEEIYQTLHKCTIQEAKQHLPFSTLCSKTEQITDDMVPKDMSVLHTIIAVYMVAQGLNSIPSCRKSQFDISACLTNLNQNRNQEIYQAILNAQYDVLPDLLGANSFSFTFDKSGYGTVGFDVLNYHANPNGAGYIYAKLGTYTDSLQLSTQNYAGLSLFDAGVIPKSNCVGLECKCTGYTSSTGTGFGAVTVVSSWTYVPREASIKVTEEGRNYQDPETGELYYVESIPDTASRFSNMWGVAVATLAAIGVFVSLCLFIYLLVVYPVRGGTSILGYVLSFGIILLYALVFAFVAHVNSELCGLRRFCLGFCYAICYSVLFVKLVDCWRSREKEDMFEVKYKKLGRPFGLFMVCVLLVLVQVIINVEWLILEPPKMVRIFYDNQYWPRCTPNDFYDEGLVLSLVYIMVLIMLTILLGFCTFNSPKNHRESRWILGIAILAVPTWVVWCAWSILGAVNTRDAAVAIGLLINATILLLLGPCRKLYLLNKYQALIEEQDRQEQREGRSVKDGVYSGIYENQYSNAPRLRDSGSTHGSTRGYSYIYQASSIGHSGR